ncbi:hypothetical protein HPB50_015303 [Hyalomma asiaticum]|uniref:Uncharacterized protein n=1 Tax=Hyalomma asiaticum TaxID=266040 RepID=A0ACB7RL10_HYAAI|nr:hypothetical protein HPB50_015303 [Hyalomma asiaticum]
MYHYIRDFLRHLIATLIFCDHSLPGITLGAPGTPQGAVVSLFFSILRFFIFPSSEIKYPISTSASTATTSQCAYRGSDADLEKHLQYAQDTIDTYVRGRGLACSPSKSELFLYRPTQRNLAIAPISLTLLLISLTLKFVG